MTISVQTVVIIGLLILLVGWLLLMALAVMSKRSPPATPEECALWKEQFRARNALEERLLDDYVKLPNRPRVGCWVRAIETSDPVWDAGGIDIEHCRRWIRARMPKED